MTLSADIKYKSNGQQAALKGVLWQTVLPREAALTFPLKPNAETSGYALSKRF